MSRMPRYIPRAGPTYPTTTTDAVILGARPAGRERTTDPRHAVHVKNQPPLRLCDFLPGLSCVATTR